MRGGCTSERQCETATSYIQGGAERQRSGNSSKSPVSEKLPGYTAGNFRAAGKANIVHLTGLGLQP